MPRTGARNPIVGVVGALQFDVIQARMASEYGIPCEIDILPHVAARWPEETAPDAPPLKVPISGVMVVEDRQQRTVLLFASPFELRYCIESNPQVRFHDTF
jgi:peptide chain release factor 3